MADPKKQKPAGRPPVADELGDRRARGRRRNRLKLLALAVLVFVTLIVAVWTIVFILTAEEEEMRLSFLTTGSIDISFSQSVAFLDDSEAVTAPVSGILVPLAANGERVAKDGDLALLVPQDRASDAQAYRSALSRYQARLFVVSGFADEAVNPQPVSPADSRLREAILEVIRSGGDEDVRSMAYAAEHFRNALERARSESGFFTYTDPELKSLDQECRKLLEVLESDPRTVRLTAPAAGEVSFVIRSPFVSLDLPQQHWDRNPQGNMDELITIPVTSLDMAYRLAEAGETLAAIRRFSGQTAAFWLPEELIGELGISQGQRLDLLKEDPDLNLPDCSVTRTVKTLDGRWYYLSCEGYPGYDARFAALSQVSVITGSVRGLRVPLTGLADFDREGESGKLRIVVGGVTKTVPVDILAWDDRYAIIASPEDSGKILKEADLYVVNPWTVEDGVLVD